MIACYRPNNRGSGYQAESLQRFKCLAKNCVISFEPPQSAHKRDHVTSKASQVRPKRLLGGLQEPQEGRNKPPRKPKWCPRTAQEGPRGSQRAPQIIENRSWKPSGHPKRNKKWKCNKPMRKSLIWNQKYNKHMRKLHVRK